jgi:catechol 2,3-dioxygenase-like lactoylglutathione lyase family enzyme
MAQLSRAQSDNRVCRNMLIAFATIALVSQATAQTRKPQIAVKLLNGLTLSVSDLPRSLEFYQSLFGMRNYARDGASPILEVGSGPAFLALRQGAGPGLDHITLGAQGFNADEALKTLAAHGVTRSATPSTAPMTAWIVTRGDTQELFLNDPSGLKIQIQDVSYCGGSGRLGDRCSRPVMLKPNNAAARVHTFNHFAVSVTDQNATRKFFQEVFGMNGSTIGSGPQWMAILKSPDGKNGLDHYCFGMENFHPDGAIRRLVEFGLTLQEGAPPPEAGKATSVYGLSGPLRTRRFTQDRSAPGKEVPLEIFLTDPDQFTVQLNDVNYCPANWGWLGDGCNPRTTLNKARFSRR